MYNHDLLNKLIDKFGLEKTAEFSEMITFMYDVMYQDVVKNGNDDVAEYDFERDWWKLKHEELKSVKQYERITRKSSSSHRGSKELVRSQND